MKCYARWFWAAILVPTSFVLFFYWYRSNGRPNTVFLDRIIGPEGGQVGLRYRTTEGTSCRGAMQIVGEHGGEAPMNWCTRKSEAVTARIVKRCDRSAGYVFASGLNDGRGSGNQFYNLAAVEYVAEMTGRCPAILLYDSSERIPDIESTFQLDDFFEYMDKPEPEFVHEFSERAGLMFDDRIKDLRFVPSWKAVSLNGYYQSHKYLNHDILRNIFQFDNFRPEIKDQAKRFLEKTTPAMWRGKPFLRVGVHGRRGDYLEPYNIEYGYTVPDAAYFQRSIQYMVDKFRPVPIQVIIASDDPNWFEENIQAHMFNGSVEVTISKNHSPGVDLAILGSCDHLILSTGTFGHFAAWLLTWKSRGNSTFMYYENFPRIGSELESLSKKEEFFYPDWMARK